RPRSTKSPPKASMIPANQASLIAAGTPEGGAAGKPTSFCVPCSMKSRATTIRSTLSALGAQSATSPAGRAVVKVEVETLTTINLLRTHSSETDQGAPRVPQSGGLDV